MLPATFSGPVEHGHPSTPRPHMQIQWWVRLGLALCAVALLTLNWAMRRERVAPAEVDSGAVSDDGDDAEPRLINEGWHITNMATAHGAFVIEVEAADPSQTEAIARALVEPIQEDYDEILVYVHTLGDDSDLPARRMQWTPAEGYVEIAYDQPSPDR